MNNIEFPKGIEVKNDLMKQYGDLLNSGSMFKIVQLQNKDGPWPFSEEQKKLLLNSAKKGIDSLIRSGVNAYEIRTIISLFEMDDEPLSTYLLSKDVLESISSFIVNHKDGYKILSTYEFLPVVGERLMLQENIKNMFENYVCKGMGMFELKNMLKSTPELLKYLNSEKIHEHFYPHILNYSNIWNFFDCESKIIDDINYINLPQIMIRSLAQEFVHAIFTKEELLSQLNTNFRSVKTFIQRFPYAKEYFETPGIQKLALNALNTFALDGNYDRFFNLAQLCDINESEFSSIKNSLLLACLHEQNADKFQTMLYRFEFNETSTLSQEIVSALNTKINTSIKNPNISETLKLINCSNQIKDQLDIDVIKNEVLNQLQLFQNEIVSGKDFEALFTDMFEYVQLLKVPKNQVSIFMGNVATYFLDTHGNDAISKMFTEMSDGVFKYLNVEDFYNKEKNKLDTTNKITLQIHTQKSLEPLLKKTVDIFGATSDGYSYEVINNISQDVIDANAKSLGVKQGGSTGLNQLQQGYARLKKEITLEDFDLSKIISNPIVEKLFLNYTRAGIAQFNGNEIDSITRIETFIDAMDKKLIGEIPTYMIDSPHVDIVSVDIEKIKIFNFSPDFIKKYRNYQKILSDVISKKDNKEFQANLLQDFNEKAKILIDESIAQLQKLPEHIKKSKEAGMLAYQKITNFNISNLEAILNNAQIFNNPEINELVITMLCLETFKKFPQLEKSYKNILKSNEISAETITNMVDLFDHIIKSELVKDFDLSKNSQKALKQIIQTPVLNQELSRALNQSKAGTKSFKFVPTRGILGEFSGEIADACWANKVDEGLLVKHPNITPVIMFSNPENSYERPCGAAMLIEAQANNGDPLLIIRGLNPLENTINQLDVEDFVNAFVSYTKELAESTGRKLCIVIDDHCGGSCTNRPVLYSYLNELKMKLENIEIPFDKTTIFNDYDISGDTYAI